jgi:hypothetical protein
VRRLDRWVHRIKSRFISPTCFWENDSRVSQAKANKRCKLLMSFLAKQASNPAQPADIRQLLCNPLTGTRQKQELQAVERLLGGIEWLEEEVWVSRSRISQGCIYLTLRPTRPRSSRESPPRLPLWFPTTRLPLDNAIRRAIAWLVYCKGIR